MRSTPRHTVRLTLLLALPFALVPNAATAQEAEAQESAGTAPPQEIVALEPDEPLEPPDEGTATADELDPEKPEAEIEGEPEPALAAAAPEPVDAEAESPILPRSQTPEEP